MAALPLILAGPILRRVEPRLVCVWVALSEPRSVLLSVFSGREQTGPGPGTFTGGTPVVAGAANTLRVGAKLHVATVVAEIPPPPPPPSPGQPPLPHLPGQPPTPPPPIQPLIPGQNFSYNLAFGQFVGVESDLDSNAAVLDKAQVQPLEDLKSLGLLRNGPLDGRPHLALGYEHGELPGFALPPAELTNLRILHGSCRRPGFTYTGDSGETTFDGLAWVDDLILRWRGAGGTPPFDANVRPHQLFLTGDQIYADDVATPLLPVLNAVGNELLGRVEKLPTHYPPKTDEPSKEDYLGVPKPQGFTTIAEFVRKMTEQDRDPFDALNDDRRVRVLSDPCLKRRFHLLYKAQFTVDPAVDQATTPDGLRQWPADLRHFPTGLRKAVMQCETKFTSDDLGTHLMSFGEFCAMYLATVSNVVWPLKADGKPDLPTIEQVYTLPPNALPQIWDLHAFSFKNEYVARTDRTKLDKALADRRTEDGNGFKRVVATLNVFHHSLPRVRRALANIPTYMVFDDHDVTDDWNLTRSWRDQVHTTPLGRRIITSAMVAYALFQDWGNDPKRYWSGANRQLLEATFQLFPEGTTPTQPPLVMDALSTLLSLNQPDPESPPPKLKWHFTIDGPRHRMVVLDIRTRRHFRSRHLPPGLLTPQALDEQVPDPTTTPLPAGVEVLMVLSQTPVVLPALAASVILPAGMAFHGLSGHKVSRNLEGAADDNEIWLGDAQAYERLLRRLSRYQRVVVISGEVHFGFGGQLTYWEKGPKRFTLTPDLRPDLDGGLASTRLAEAFQDAGFPLLPGTELLSRPGNQEWLVIALLIGKTFLVREESDGLNVYEELEPARLAQFTSSGLKNVKALIAQLVALLGFGFTLLDLVPAERLIWKDSTPAAMLPPTGQRFPPGVRGRVSSEPVLLPSGNWPEGSRMSRQPDFAWRYDLVRDERDDDGPDPRPEFARPGDLPEFDPSDVDESYRQIANAHARQLDDDRHRFGRGILTQTNLGLVRFTLDGQDLVACQDLYGHRPGHDEVTLVNTYRVPLRGFGQQRPMLRFDLPDGR